MRLNRSPKTTRNRRAAKPTRRHWRWALPVLGVALLGGAGSWAVSSGWLDRQSQAATQAFFAATATAGLAVDDVLVEGRNRTAAAEVLATLGVNLLQMIGSAGLWVEANLKETELGRVRTGQQAEVTLDAYPDFE